MKKRFIIATALITAILTLAATGCKKTDTGGANDNVGALTGFYNGVTDGDTKQKLLSEGKFYSMPKKLTFTARSAALTASTAQTVNLQATITPSNATVKDVVWTVAFVNPASTWANDKAVSDYLTVTPVEGDSLKAVVSCKQDFGEQIKITVTSLADRSKTATCIANYDYRVLSATATSSQGGAIDLLNDLYVVLDNDCVNETIFTYDIKRSTGTQNRLGLSFTIAQGDDFETFKNDTGLNASFEFTRADAYWTVMGSLGITSEEDKVTALNWIRNHSSSSVLKFGVKINVVDDNNQTLVTGETRWIPIRFNPTKVYIPVNSVALDNSELTF